MSAREIVVGIEESASYVEDMWPDEVEFLAQKALEPARARIAELEAQLADADAIIDGAHMLERIEARRAHMLDRSFTEHPSPYGMEPGE